MPPSSTSLQIPADSPAGPSRQHPPSSAHAVSSAAASRPVSASVHQPSASPAPPSASASSRRQQRASHTVVSPTQHPQQHPIHPHAASHDDSTPPYTDVYSHSAAVAYIQAHPRRTIPKFGPYLLLQTLGEGEFGKVKLGLHSQWGEEVAVKLIRRGNVDSTVRMSKVEREIEVLRTLKHPNIVRLYDVIETDKYIGIILEYASGGELFDHILAHRYLREKDAAKLFSQLISGVWYIHQKKIVHRDLKLENLLLDRHRNVIITDFGFANRFEHRSDDLMQTSCGSPCYAAPELVISEGLYVGSAVDIWSCGVILYAMLAGYLPFDDDPANPDGDNINLLYKYIVNTPLSFPDYISPEARDLLGMMLVPDPTRRASLEGVMRHPWLGSYATGPPRSDGVPAAFGKTVDDLERVAMEQHQQKRLAYQKQMKAAAMAKENSPHLPRSQSHQQHAGASSPVAASGTQGSRSRSTQPEYLYDSSVDQSIVSPAAGGVNTTPTNANGRTKTFNSPAALGLSEDDPFAAPGSSSGANNSGAANNNNNVVVTTTTTTTTSKGRTSDERTPTTLAPTQSPSGKGHKSGGSGGGGGFRHTIQVEYDEPKTSNSGAGRRSGDRHGRERSGSQGQGQEASVNGVYQQQQQQNGALPVSATPTPTKERRPSQSSGSSKPLPPSPAQPSTAGTPSSFRLPPSATYPVPTSKVTPPTPVKTPSSARPNPISPPGPDISVSSPPETPLVFGDGEGREREKDKESQTSVSSAKKGHSRGKSSLDKLGLGKIFGGSSGSSGAGMNGAGAGHASPAEVTPASARGHQQQQVNGAGSANASVNGVDSSSASMLLSPEKEGRKSRRNTLTVMVEPISRTIRNRGAKGRMASTPLTADEASAASGGGSKKSTSPAAPRSALLPSAGTATPTPSAGVEASPSFGTAELEAGGMGMQASTSKARKVMQWFRTKSKGRESVGLGPETEDESGRGEKGHHHQLQQQQQQPQQEKYRRGYAASSSTVNQQKEKEKELLSPVQVVVTTPTTAAPRVVPTTPIYHQQRTPSSATDGPPSGTPSFVARFRSSVTVGGLGSHQQQQQQTPSAPKHPHEKLRVHHGAVDQTTITTRAPPEVMKHVKEVLEGMGVEIQLESEYKYRCIRGKKRKGAMSPTAASVAGGSVGPSGLAAVTMVGSAASNGVDKRGLPLPSPSTFAGTGGMLRGLLMRRQSSQVSNSGMSSQPSLAFDDESSVVVSEPIMISDTAYGDPTQDAGDEVRFSVELTRLDRLNDTYSLDIRRLKGNLRSYKFLYDTLRQRADLQR